MTTATQARSHVGRDVPRVEDSRLLRGQGRYVDDIDPADTLHAAFVRSMHANARIVGVDVDAARALPGVRLVLTAADLGELNNTLPLLSPHPALSAPRTARPLAAGRVRHVGEAIAMVVADTRYIAEDAASLVVVDYEPLEAVVDLATAGEVSARVHDDAPGNLAGVLEDSVGDAATVIREAPFVERLTLSLERSCASPMETRGVLAQWDPRLQKLTVWDSTQAPVAIKHGLCRLLNLSSEKVDVIAPDVGGGFGVKIMLFYPEEVLVPHAARILSRPVKWIEDRWEHFVSGNQERGQRHEAEIAFDESGKILAVRTTFLHDTGAYIPYGVAVPANTITHILGQYRVKHYSATARILYTNKPAVSPYRGAGRPHAVFVMERLICAIAARLNLEPHEVRARNLIRSDEFPYDVGLHVDAPVRYDSGNYELAFEKVLKHIEPNKFREEQLAARASGRYIGFGMGTYVESTGPGPYEAAVAALSNDGKVVIDVATASQGQGHGTSFAQIAADAIGARLDQVVVRGGDSSRIDYGLGTFGSRSLLLAGNAVASAAAALRQQMAAFAARLLDSAPDALVFEEGWASVVGLPELAVSFAALAALANPYGYPVDRQLPDNPETLAVLTSRAAAINDVSPVFEAKGFFGAGQQLYGSGVHAAIVEVDVETGGIKVLKYVLAHDCGVMVNPKIVEGQVLGGLVQGLGGALLERLPFDSAGQPQATSFMDFRLPTADDVPDVTIEHVETPSPLNPLGVKGTGEAGIIPVSATIAQAIEDALTPFGARILSMPLMPHDITALVRQGRPAGAPEVT